jgi:regulatory protein
MKITAISQQIKRPGRYSIYVDTKFSFGLDANQVLELGVVQGQEITEAELAAFKGESELGKVFEKTLNLLSIRPRSEWELQDYLKRKKQSPAVIEKTLNKLSNLGYVDDAAFAKRWVDNRRLLKPTSSLKLRAELKQKHLANDVIEQALRNDETDEVAVLRQLIERKSQRYPDKQKLMVYLARQGFRYDDIKRALSQDDEY